MKTLRPILALVALASLVVCILACRSSFSPDGSKILMPAAGGEFEQGHLLMYDRPTAKWTHLLSVASPHRGDDVPIPTAIWTADGKEVIASWAADSRIVVSVLPVGRPSPTRFYQFDISTEGEDADKKGTCLIEPPVLRGRHLLFGGQVLTVLNLDSGEINRQELPVSEGTNNANRGIWLFGQGKEICYLMGSDDEAEAGRLDVSDLAHLRLVPSVKLDPKKEDGNPFVAVSAPDGRLALTGGDEDNQSLLIYRQSKLERTFPFGAATNNGTMLGNHIWSLDGKTLYAAGFRSLEPGPFAKAVHASYEALRSLGFRPSEPRPFDLQVLVCEIPLDGRPVRETPLFRMASSRNETYRMLYQIALSPDGRTLAVGDGYAWAHTESRKPNLALYLMDLSAESRPVSRIPIPSDIAKAAGLLPK
jgi:hypothetical protein